MTTHGLPLYMRRTRDAMAGMVPRPRVLVISAMCAWLGFVITRWIYLSYIGGAERGEMFLTAMLAPSIAMIAAYIGWAQMQTAREKLRLDLFERRYQVFDAVEGFLGKTLVQGKPSLQQEIDYANATAPSRMLFGPDVELVIARTWKDVSLLFALEATYPAQNGAPRTNHAAKILKLREEMQRFHTSIPSAFASYLRFDKRS
jgi:hypothetical protein